MGKLIVSEFVSIDGVMEAPGGEEGYKHSGWVFDFSDKKQEEYKLKETLDAEVLLLGRVTYEGFADAWPEREGEFADKMNSMPKHVASTTLSDLEWENSTLISDDIPGAVSKLKGDTDGPVLVAGSQTLVHTLVENDLVDEFRIMVFPVVLGSGRRLFDDLPDKTVLKLADTKTFDSGVTVLTYERAG